jgi:hypothetical protein
MECFERVRTRKTTAHALDRHGVCDQRKIEHLDRDRREPLERFRRSFPGYRRHMNLSGTDRARDDRFSHATTGVAH